MTNLEWFFTLMIVVGLAGIVWVYLHDSHKTKPR